MKTPTKAIEKLRKKIAKKKPKGFQKGNNFSKGAPKGAVTYDREALLARKIDNVTITNYLTLNSHLTEAQLNQRLKDPNISSLEKGMVRQLLAVSKDGAIGPLQFVLDRLVGKPKQEIELSKKDPLKDLSPEELLEMKKEIEIINRQSMQLLEQTNPRVQEQLKNYDEQLRSTTNTNKKELS